MKKWKQFKEGDKVFAKVKGYPAWPAIIIQKKSQRFKVQFYGTRETGSVKGEDLFYYLKHRDQLIKSSKKKEFKDALDEIEEAIAQAGGSDGSDIPAIDENLNGNKRKRRNSEESTDSQPTKKSDEQSKSPDSDRGINDDSVSIKPEIDTEVDDDNRSTTTEVPTVENRVENSVVELISERSLQHWIDYGDFVKTHPTLYNSRKPYIRDHSSTQCLPVLLPSTNKYIGLKLHQHWPLQQFQNEYDNAMYDREIAENLLQSKQRLENNEQKLDDIDINQYFQNIQFTTEDEINNYFEMKLLNAERKRVERLSIEKPIVEFDLQIKTALSMDKAEPDQAIQSLNDMLTFEYFDEIMLKKHPHIVQTIRKLRKYVGNLENWNLNEEESETFRNKAKKICQLANDLYIKIKGVVKLPPDTERFSDGFETLVTKFKEDCSDLSRPEIMSLDEEPYSRNSILTVFEFRDFQAKRIKQHEQKENSSDAANTENKVSEESGNLTNDC